MRRTMTVKLLLLLLVLVATVHGFSLLTHHHHHHQYYNPSLSSSSSSTTTTTTPAVSTFNPRQPCRHPHQIQQQKQHGKSVTATTTTRCLSSSPFNQETTTTTSSTQSQKNDDEDDQVFVRIPSRTPSDQWELDCYSRPVLLAGNKKLWEVLLTDANGSFQYVKRLPSTSVNSKTLRQVIETVVEEYGSGGGGGGGGGGTLVEKPSVIRFFRGSMFNMISIALSELDVVGRPSRCTFALAQWLQQRHRDVYPNMAGYRANMVSSMSTTATTSVLDIRTPVKLPDALRGERYAFCALPLAEFLPGGSIQPDNIGVGRLCPVTTTIEDEYNNNKSNAVSSSSPAAAAATTAAPADVFVQGICIFTSRAKALASWLAGTELYAVSCDLRKRIVTMETDIDTSYLMARLNDNDNNNNNNNNSNSNNNNNVQRQEAAIFEESKDQLGGLHFVCVQRDEEDDQPAGFWLLRELPMGI